MLGDTFILGLASGSKTLNLINNDSYGTEYYLREALKSYTVKIRHSQTNGGYDRHNVEAVITTFATATVPEAYHKVYFVIEALPSDGDVEPTDALADWAIVTLNSNLTALFGWES